MKKTIIFLISFLSVFCLVNNSVSGDACGYISNVYIDAWGPSGSYLGWVDMVRLNNSEYYLYTTVNQSWGHYLRTFEIENDDGLIGSVLDHWDRGTVGSPSCYFLGHDLEHYRDDIYLTAGCEPNKDVRVYSWKVWGSNGTIWRGTYYRELSEDMSVWCGTTCAYDTWLDMVILDNGVVLVSFTNKDDSDALYLISLLVNSDQTLSFEKDKITVNGTGYNPRLYAIDEDTVCVMYNDGSADGWLKTYDVEADGDIGDADDHYESCWEFEPDHMGELAYNIENVYGDKYLLAYQSTGLGLQLKTIRIYDNGIIIESFIDNSTLDSTTGTYPRIFRVKEGIMAIAYCGAASDGYIRSFNITHLGYLDDSYIDEWEYWDAVTIKSYASVIYISGNYFAIMVERYATHNLYRDPYVYTYEIECATGDTGQIGSLYINAYDEATLEPIDFNITFFAGDWGDSYSELYCNTSCTPCPCEDCSDSWNITFDQLPQGTDCYMIVGNGSYHDRYFMMDIYDEFISFEGDTYYTLCLNVFLAPESARLYNIKVIDNFYNPVDDVEIRVKKYVDPSIGIIDISTLHTDSYGLAQIYLIAEYPYIFNCSKEDYYPVNFVWIPPDADNITKTIKMTYMFEEGPDIENISMDSLVLSAYNSTTMEIFYLNLNEDNQYVDFTVYDYFNDSSVLTTYYVEENPNNITLLFTWTDYDLIGDILKVTAVATRINESTYTLSGYFNIQQAREQVGNAYLHLILSVAFCFFGLTIASPKNIFGPIGIIVMVIGIGITAFALQTWYIHLIQAVEIILLIFVLMVFKEEGATAV